MTGNGENFCVVDDLLQQSFSSRSFTEKKAIIEKGAPKPLLNINVESKTCTRHFSSKLYDNANWLTGSPSKNKFFCWPCLLFSVENNVWRTSGYGDLNNFYKAVDRHGKKSSDHFKSVLALSKFGTGQRIEHMLDSNFRSSIIKHNELVKKNREIIKILIDVVCYLACQEQALNKKKLCNAGNFLC